MDTDYHIYLTYTQFNGYSLPFLSEVMGLDSRRFHKRRLPEYYTHNIMLITAEQQDRFS